MFPEELATGTVLRGTYEVVGRVGRGGMGVVYEVTHARLAGRYALKLFARDDADSGEARKRFRREADIVSSLRHPHIVQVVDFDEMPDGRPYLVMEMLDGENLSDRLRRKGPLPLAMVILVVKQVASALSAAHARGIVHRDLKPENIFLVRLEGQDEDLVKVVDFGISKIKESGLRLTGERVLLGTPYYMAPEQTRGAAHVDEKADQFALGSIVYELLTGELAFGGREFVAVIYQLLHHEPTRLADGQGLVSPAADQVLRRALAKNPADRFPSIADFARAFEDAARGLPTQGHTVTAVVPASSVDDDASVRSVSPTTRLSDWWDLDRSGSRRWYQQRRLALALAVGAAALTAIWALSRPAIAPDGSPGIDQAALPPPPPPRPSAALEPASSPRLDPPAVVAPPRPETSAPAPAPGTLPLAPVVNDPPVPRPRVRPATRPPEERLYNDL
jgi:eukaryotic-like serine/threonine-protein kinase